MPLMNDFSVPDYIVFVITIVVSLGIGIYYALSGGRQRTTSEYLVGNRRMSVLPVAISLMVSFESSIMMLGTPAEIYRYGIQWIWANIAWFFANLLAVKIMVPLIHPLKITSAYEYLELRFNSPSLRLLGTFLGMVNYTLYMGIVLFGPAIALEAVTGFPIYASILAVALASIIYTAIGGLKAVIWTDVFQCIVMFSGVFAVLIKGTISAGGVVETWRVADRNGRLNWFNFDTDITTRHSFWNLFVGTLVRGLTLIFNQASVQRISATSSFGEAKRVMLYTAPGFLITISLAVIEGIVAYAYYHKIGCDPLASKQIRNPNQIIPAMVMSMFEGLPGMPGLFIASLFSASLSTLSSGLSSLSALLWTDFVKPFTKPMSEFKATVIAKISVVFFGGLCIAVAFLVSTIGGTLNQIGWTILSAIGGPMTGLFMLGCFCPWANAKGAWFSCVTGVFFVGWIAGGMMMSPGVKRTPPLPPAPIDQCFPEVSVANETNVNWTATIMTNLLTTEEITSPSAIIKNVEPKGLDLLYSISYTLLGLIGVFYGIIVGSIVSFLTGYTKPKDSNPKYLISLMDEVLFFVPESIRRPLRFGYRYHTGYDREQAYYKDKEMSEKEFHEDKVHNLADVHIVITPTEKTNDVQKDTGNKVTTPDEHIHVLTESHDKERDALLNNYANGIKSHETERESL